MQCCIYLSELSDHALLKRKRRKRKSSLADHLDEARDT
jgi:hypothetical protein